MHVLVSARKPGKWAAILQRLRLLWERGEETCMVTPDVEIKRAA